MVVGRMREHWDENNLVLKFILSRKISMGIKATGMGQDNKLYKIEKRQNDSVVRIGN
jgi:hypothetical protein